MQFLKQQSCKLSHNSWELLQQRVARAPSTKRKTKPGALTRERPTTGATGLGQSERRVGPLPAGDWRSGMGRGGGSGAGTPRQCGLNYRGVVCRLLWVRVPTLRESTSRFLCCLARSAPRCRWTSASGPGLWACRKWMSGRSTRCRSNTAGRRSTNWAKCWHPLRYRGRKGCSCWRPGGSQVGGSAAQWKWGGRSGL